MKDKSNNEIISSSIFVKGPSSSPVVDLLEDSKLEVNCFGDNDAFISLSLSGVFHHIPLLLNNNVILNNLNEGEDYKIYNLSAREYSIKVIDDNGCVSESKIFTVEQPNSALEISNFSLNNSTAKMVTDQLPLMLMEELKIIFLSGLAQLKIILHRKKI